MLHKNDLSVFLSFSISGFSGRSDLYVLIRSFCTSSTRSGSLSVPLILPGDTDGAVWSLSLCLEIQISRSSFRSSARPAAPAQTGESVPQTRCLGPDRPKPIATPDFLLWFVLLGKVSGGFFECLAWRSTATPSGIPPISVRERDGVKVNEITAGACSNLKRPRITPEERNEGGCPDSRTTSARIGLSQTDEFLDLLDCPDTR
jgi:hypothetical protein